MRFNIELDATFTMVLTLISVEVESSGGHRGELSEKILKSPHKIVHKIEVKAPHHSQVSNPQPNFLFSCNFFSCLFVRSHKSCLQVGLVLSAVLSLGKRVLLHRTRGSHRQYRTEQEVLPLNKTAPPSPVQDHGQDWYIPQSGLETGQGYPSGQATARSCRRSFLFEDEFKF